MNPCISEPLSYLQLERYSLGELPAAQEQRVVEHLARCPACRACYERVQSDDRTQQLAALAAQLAAVASGPQLSAAVVRRPQHRASRWAALALVASFAGLLFLVVQPRQRSGTSPDLEPPSSSKGAALALEVVRVDQHGRQLEPTQFAAGDRFKLLVTCPEAHARQLRVLAFQGGEVFEPVPAQELPSCGNRRALRGAWQFDGTSSVELCVVFGVNLQLEHVRAPDALPEAHACTHLDPADLATP